MTNNLPQNRCTQKKDGVDYSKALKIRAYIYTQNQIEKMIQIHFQVVYLRGLANV